MSRFINSERTVLRDNAILLACQASPRALENQIASDRSRSLRRNVISRAQCRRIGSERPGPSPGPSRRSQGIADRSRRANCARRILAPNVGAQKVARGELEPRRSRYVLRPEEPRAHFIGGRSIYARDGSPPAI